TGAEEQREALGPTHARALARARVARGRAPTGPLAAPPSPLVQSAVARAARVERRHADADGRPAVPDLRAHRLAVPPRSPRAVPGDPARQPAAQRPRDRRPRRPPPP